MRTFSQLVGSTATTSAVSYPASFTTLSNNNSAANVAMGKELTNNTYRYLLQRYFDNERTLTMTTVGGMSLTLTGSLSIGATSATLTASWTYPTCTQLVNFSGAQQQSVLFTNGSASITWAQGLTATATTAISTVGVQNYSIPANVSKSKNVTINVGQLKYQPIFIQSIQEWDNINFLPYTSSIPNYAFIFNGTMRIYPVPSTTGNIITINYKTRVADMTFDDYSTGHIAAAGMVAGSTTVTGLVTNWNSSGGYPLGVDISSYGLYIRANPPFGDGIWYPITSFTSDTVLTLGLPVVSAPNITASTTYTIGQIPILQEDFHDMIVYGSLVTYYTAIVESPDKAKQFQGLYNLKLELLEDYAGTKQVNVDLGAEPTQVNPNLFIFGQS